MSQADKNTYEIHTSMSEDLILEELGQMKGKFIPAAKFLYTTHYTPQQCMEFMKHANENDIYEYEWRLEKSFGALIIKNYKKRDRVHDFASRQEWGFVVRFHEQSGGAETLIEAKLVQTEKLPYIHNRP